MWFLLPSICCNYTSSKTCNKQFLSFTYVGHFYVYASYPRKCQLGAMMFLAYGFLYNVNIPLCAHCVDSVLLILLHISATCPTDQTLSLCYAVYSSYVLQVPGMLLGWISCLSAHHDGLARHLQKKTALAGC